jgi:hypothetical protein
VEPASHRQNCQHESVCVRVSVRLCVSVSLCLRVCLCVSVTDGLCNSMTHETPDTSASMIPLIEFEFVDSGSPASDGAGVPF